MSVKTENIASKCIVCRSASRCRNSLLYMKQVDVFSQKPGCVVKKIGLCRIGKKKKRGKNENQNISVEWRLRGGWDYLAQVAKRNRGDERASS